MKTIKIKEHYYIVDDSMLKNDACWHIPIDKWYIDDCNEIRQSPTNNTLYWSLRKDYHIITHSTEQLEGVVKLELSDVEEALYGYNVNKMADNQLGSNLAPSIGSSEAYIRGFNAHKELVKDKLFTIEEVKEAFLKGMNYAIKPYPINIEYERIFMQSLLPKTEWEVTIDENNKITLV